MGIFQPRRTLWPLLCDLRFWGADPPFLPGMADEEKDPGRKAEYHAGPGFSWDRVMEATRGEWMWDYTRFSFNFQGRVALNPSIRFGIGGMIFLYILQPLFEKGVRKMPQRAVQIVSLILAVLLCADVIYLIFR